MVTVVKIMIFLCRKTAIFFKLMHFLLNHTRLMIPHEEEYKVLQEKKSKVEIFFEKLHDVKLWCNCRMTHMGICIC